MDPAVSKCKFDRELDFIRGEAAAFTALASWGVIEATYPVLAVVFTHPRSKRRVGFQFLCDDWDDQPPSLCLFDPGSRAELAWAKWPHEGWSAGDSHPTTGKPFLCLPGIREYHIHTSHVTDRWDNLRGRNSYSLRYILHRVQDKFGVTNG